MDLGLDGRIVLIAGASRGIGLGIAMTCLEEGATVMLAARGADALEETRAHLAGRFGADRVFAQAGDFRSTGFTADLIARTEREVGPIWGAVGNVGMHPCPPGYDIDDETFAAGIDQNLGTAFRLARAVLPGMQARGEGSLLFISSLAAVAPGTELTYGTAKAALNLLTRELAGQVGRSGVRVNALSPGPTWFPGGGWDERFASDKSETWTKWLKRSFALGRTGTPEEMGSVAALLLSPRSSFVTGAIWAVDGGPK